MILQCRRPGQCTDHGFGPEQCSECNPKLTGWEGYKHFLKVYPPPLEGLDWDLVDSLLEGDIYIDEQGKFHLTAFVDCQGEA